MLYRHCLDTWHSLNYFHYIKILIIILLYTNIGLQLHHSAEELVHINYGFGIYNKNIFINWKVKFVLFICFSVQKQADVQTFVTKVSLPALYIKLRKIFLRCVTFVFLSSFIPFFNISGLSTMETFLCHTFIEIIDFFINFSV